MKLRTMEKMKWVVIRGGPRSNTLDEQSGKTPAEVVAVRPDMIDRKELAIGRAGRTDCQAEGIARAKALRQEHSGESTLVGER